jgi:RNA polymerase sigma-70 factor (ECF subfamily)
VVKHRAIEAARARGRRPAPVDDITAFDARAVRDAIDPIGELEDILSALWQRESLFDEQGLLRVQGMIVEG